jgi:curved DNA-binding protein CbpA
VADGLDPYTVLQVSPGVDPEVIRAAYRALARRWHPDHSTDAAADTRMAEINAAWEVLGDPSLRAAHDRAVRDGRAASGAGSTAASGAEVTRAPAPSVSSAPSWRMGPDGEGSAGPPPGHPSGSVLDFGRHVGWSLGEIARVDPGYLEWLERTPRGQRHREEIDRILRRGSQHRDRQQAPPGPARKGRFGLPGR